MLKKFASFNLRHPCWPYKELRNSIKEQNKSEDKMGPMGSTFKQRCETRFEVSCNRKLGYKCKESTELLY